MMNNYTVKEWESLCFGDGEGEIPPRLAKMFDNQSQSTNFSGKVIEYRRSGLRARGVVGILATPECGMEILPKIDVRPEDCPGGEMGEIRKRLVHMLSVVLGMKLDTGLAAQIDWQRDTLLEILIQIFRVKLSEAVRRGMPRRYVHCEDDLPALRGTLDSTRQFTRHAADPSRLACRFDELSDDIALNRVMKATVAHLLDISRSSENLRHLGELAFVYSDITHVPAAALPWDEVVIDRTNRAWWELCEMARLFLGRRYQTTSSGKGIGTSILFDMNVLFEKYIGQIAKRSMVGSDYKVVTQGGGRPCLTTKKDRGRGVFRTRPDILIRRGDRVELVIDTKWKRISGFPGERRNDVSQNDVYQMMAYAHVYEARRVMLLYPHHDGLGSDDGIQEEFQITGQGGEILYIASVNVAVGSKIAKSQLRELMRRALDES